MKYNDEDVLSEVHISSDFLQCEDGYITRFPIDFLCEETKTLENVSDMDRNSSLKLDNDGDFCRPDNENDEERVILTLKHYHATPLSSVGKQVWMGSLVMADFILDSDEFSNSHCIELGSGVGLCSIVSQMKSQRTICTDFDNNVLNLCQENIDINSSLNKNVHKQSCIDVKHLNWSLFDDVSLFTDTSLLQKKESRTIDEKFCWTTHDINMLKKTDIIFAADCIYDENLSSHLFNAIHFLLLKSEKQKIDVYISLEKRINFSLAEMDVAASSYKHFMIMMNSIRNGEYFTTLDAVLEVEEIPLQFPKYLSYERNKYLELWKITCLKNEKS